MPDLEHIIYDCLKMFGPCDLRTIQMKLDALNIVKSLNDIDNACESMVSKSKIKEADGFCDKAYKV